MAHDVFISYSKKDKTVADAACSHLEAAGIRCWIAPRDVLPGMGWGAAIVDSIQAARVMVLVFSAEANKSPQILREVERAVNAGTVVVPFRIEDVLPSGDLEYFISAHHWLDAMTPPLKKHLGRLTQTVERLLAEKKRGQDAAGPDPTPSPRPALNAPGPTPTSNNGDAQGAAPSKLRWKPILLFIGGGLIVAFLVRAVDVDSAGHIPPQDLPLSETRRAPAPEQAPTGFRVAWLMLGKQVDYQDKVTASTSMFGSWDTIYASVNIEGSEAVNLTSNWTYLTINMKMGSFSATVYPPTNYAFHTHNPKGFPGGSYRVEIIANGQTVASKDFEIRE
jgi:hypothetical protein